MVSHYLYHLKQNGVFQKIKGIWLGNYEHESGITLEQILLETIEGGIQYHIKKTNNLVHYNKNK